MRRRHGSRHAPGSCRVEKRILGTTRRAESAPNAVELDGILVRAAEPERPIGPNVARHERAVHCRTVALASTAHQDQRWASVCARMLHVCEMNVHGSYRNLKADSAGRRRAACGCMPVALSDGRAQLAARLMRTCRIQLVARRGASRSAAVRAPVTVRTFGASASAASSRTGAGGLR